MIQFRKIFPLKGTKKAFSLVEMVVSLGVISIIIIIFFNALITSLKITYTNLNRSNLREEMSILVNLISRDLRNADIAENCSQLYCELKIGTETSVWGLCDTDTFSTVGFITTFPTTDAEKLKLRVCKTTSGTLVYASSAILKIDSFIFEDGFSSISNKTNKNIVVTIIGSHSNANLKINNVVRQSSVSLRNYAL